MPASIKFVNVGTVTTSTGATMNFDIELTNRSTYRPQDAALNGFTNGKFCQVNLASGQSVQLRATLQLSCSTASSCRVCAEAPLTSAGRINCYASGCSCYGTTVYNQAACTGSNAVALKNTYGCPSRRKLQQAFVFPEGTIASLTAYDLDTDPTGNYIEQFSVPDYAYFKTPLRPLSGNSVATSVFVNTALKTFTGTASSGTASDLDDRPSDPKQLTDEQASKGVQFFFHPENGYIDTTFSVAYTGTDANPGGRNLLFAGDSALCEPPPPAPPSPPPPLRRFRPRPRRPTHRRPHRPRLRRPSLRRLPRFRQPLLHHRRHLRRRRPLPRPAANARTVALATITTAYATTAV